MENDAIKKRIISYGNIPCHVAVIMDGNGRWARQQDLPRVRGHQEGINSVREIVRACGEIDIKYLTLFTFSTENWKRPRSEISALMSLLVRTIRSEVDELKRNNVRLRVLGNLAELPFPARKGMENAIKLLQKNTGLTLNLALSYSGRREITESIRKIVHQIQAGNLSLDDINENVVAENLYTGSMPDPDLLIRTSGEFRISNFLLWQLAYTEIYVSEAFWPDFRKKEFFEAIISFQQRERRFGKVSEQLPAGSNNNIVE